MKTLKKYLLIPILFCTVSIYGAQYYTLEKALNKTADQIMSSAYISPQSTLAVVGFTESTSHLRLPISNVIEDDLSTYLIERRPKQILAKNHLDTILKELKFTREDLFDTKHRKKFGKFASVDFIVCGTYWVNSQHIIINITVVDIEKGVALYSNRLKLRKSQFASYLLG